MIKILLRNYGPVSATAALSFLCILGSVFISATIWSVMAMPSMLEGIAISALCPALVAPPVIFAFCKMSEGIAKNRLKHEEANRQLETALKAVKELTGLLPICAWCKNVRDDRGYWNKIDSYIEVRSKAAIAMGICPDCRREIAARRHSGVTEPARQQTTHNLVHASCIQE